MKRKLFHGLTILVLLSLVIFPVSAQVPKALHASQQVIPQTVSQGGLILDDSIQESALNTSHRLIVQLKSPSLSEWSRSTGNARQADGKINFAHPLARAYRKGLQAEQAAFVAGMQAALPGASLGKYIDEFGNQVDLTYQVAFNGLVVESGATPKDEARRILAGLPDVQAVYLDYAHQPDLYASLPIINAGAAWDNPVIGGMENAGAGIKVASMDGGLHHEAAMFSGTGFSYPPDYPAGGLGLTENNNGKIIASRVYFRTWDPPSPGDENPWPGVLGTSHGTHTGSTAAGNEVLADYMGVTMTLSGVAPQAWVMSYRVFYNSITNDGSFYTAEGLAALEDILMDGADALNNSWGAGPGSAGGEFDPLDLALINVSNAGTFVSMSAGNEGPNNGTSDHASSEYISVAASTTDGTFASGRLSVSAPEPVPDILMDMDYASAGFGSILPPGGLYTYDYLPAVAVDPANFEGCNPWPAGTFTGKAALISRGVCEFGVKVLNAEQAGAEFVIVHNHVTGGDELTTMAAGAVGDQVTIPSVFIGYTDGTGMLDWYTANGDASQVTLDTIVFQAGNTPDFIASFSSRGPGVGNVLKPDITAPGINIMAQGYTPGATGEDRHLGFGQASGTSMAAPHVTGAAALLRQIHPDWSNAYIKSALMSTSKYVGIWNHDDSHAQPLDMGAGRLDLTNAADPGVILAAPSVSFGMLITGTAESMPILLTSVASITETYQLSTISVGGTYPTATLDTAPGFDVVPASITLAPGASAVITVTYDSSLGQIGDNQAYVVLDGETYDAHLPAWARVAPPWAADVLLIDADASEADLEDYLAYYTTVLDDLGLTYDVLNWAVEDVWEAVYLSAYDMVVLFTGDNFEYLMSTQDMDRLTEYANNGGVIFAMGQDLSSVMASAVYDNGAFFYYSTLGGNFLQDSVTVGELPTMTLVASTQAPIALHGVQIDVSGVGPVDGAKNQAYIDEIETLPRDEIGAVYPYTALFRYPGPNNLAEGTVAMAHRAQPSLEFPGIAYFGRSIYTAFGLEGVNNDQGATNREDLFSAFMDWAWDEPVATISNTTQPNASGLTFFDVSFTSNISGTAAVNYRWDFGDGSAYAGPYTSNLVGHQYEECGAYTVRVEAVDTWGNHAIGELQTEVINCVVGPVAGVALAPAEMAGSGAPAEVVEYTLQVTNTGELTNTFTIAYTGNTWDVHLVETSLELGAGESGELVVQVTIPGDAADGATDTVIVEASGGGGVKAASHLTTTADYPEIYLPVVVQEVTIP